MLQSGGGSRTNVPASDIRRRRTGPRNTERGVQFEIGDARGVLARLPPSSATLVITSPPYWNVKDYTGGRTGEIGHGQSYEEYVASLDEVWVECARLLKPNGKIAINIQPIPFADKSRKGARSRIINIMHDVETSMYRMGLELSNVVIWDKRKYNNQRIFGSYPHPPNLFTHVSYEFVFVFRKPGSPEKIPAPRKESSKLTMAEWSDWCFDPIWDLAPVIKITGTGENRFGHLAPFPVELPLRLIRMFSFKDDLVIDPFLGSGTTLVACLLSDRRGFGVEFSKAHSSLIQQRLANPSGRDRPRRDLQGKGHR